MINLLPYKEKRTVEKVRLIRMITAVLFGLVIAVVIGGVLLVPTVLTVISRKKIADNQIALLERDGTLIRSEDLGALEGRTVLVNKKLAPLIGTQPTAHIARIDSLAPKGISINRFATTDTGALQIYGVASTRDVLQSFIKILSTDPHSSSVDSAVSNFVKATNSPFMVTVSFK
jgi:hypothetical protein